MGFDWGSALNFGTQVLQHVPSGGSSVNGSSVSIAPSGGGVSRSGCPQWPLGAVAAALASMTRAELTSLQTSLTNSHVPGASVSDPASVQYWCAGGGDCNTSSQHPDVVAFNARVSQVLRGTVTTMEPVADYGQGFPSNTAPSTGQGIIDWLNQHVLQPAVTGVEQNAIHSIPQPQQQQIAASYATSWIQKNWPLAAAAGVGAFLLLRRR